MYAAIAESFVEPAYDIKELSTTLKFISYTNKEWSQND